MLLSNLLFFLEKPSYYRQNLSPDDNLPSSRLPAKAYKGYAENPVA